MTYCDPTVEVVCEGRDCREEITVRHSEQDRLMDTEVRGEGWIVDGDHHYCSAECRAKPMSR